MLAPNYPKMDPPPPSRAQTGFTKGSLGGPRGGGPGGGLGGARRKQGERAKKGAPRTFAGNFCAWLGEFFLAQPRTLYAFFAYSISSGFWATKNVHMGFGAHFWLRRSGRLEPLSGSPAAARNAAPAALIGNIVLPITMCQYEVPNPHSGHFVDLV